MKVLYFVFDDLRVAEAGLIEDLHAFFNYQGVSWETSFKNGFLFHAEHTVIAIEIRNDEVEDVCSTRLLKSACQFEKAKT